MSEEEAEELMEEAPWHLKRWVRDLPNKELSKSTVTHTSNVTCNVTVSAEVDVRPSTSRLTVPSRRAPRREYGSDLDSDYDEEYDVVERSHRNVEVEELEEAMQGVINEMDAEMDNAADRLLGTSASFTWVSDFESFRGTREEFSGPTPGPLNDYDSPYDTFIDIWDKDIIELIVLETNRYAQQTIETKRSEGTLKPSSRLRWWTDTNADEIMVLLGMFMYMAIDPRTSITEYWTQDEVLQLPGFRRLMSYNRYVLLNKFLHFVDNTSDVSQQLLQTEDSDSVRPIG